MKSNHSTRRGPAQLLQDIYATGDNEIFCDDVAELIIRCADALYSDNEARQLYPQLFQHFRFCANCAMEYKINMELARLEAQGQLERPDVMPPLPAIPPLEKTPSVLEQLQTIFEYLFPGFSVASAVAVRGKAAYAPVTMASKDGTIQIKLQLQASSTLPGYYTLICTLTLLSAVPDSWLDQAVVQLEQADNGEIEQRIELGGNREVTFQEVAPGTYQIRLFLAGHIHLIKQIDTEIS